MAPGLERRATHRRPGGRSGLGKPLGADFKTLGLNALYRAWDRLYRHRERIGGLKRSFPAHCAGPDFRGLR